MKDLTYAEAKAAADERLARRRAKLQRERDRTPPPRVAVPVRHPDLVTVDRNSWRYRIGWWAGTALGVGLVFLLFIGLYLAGRALLGWLG